MSSYLISALETGSWKKMVYCSQMKVTLFHDQILVSNNLSYPNSIASVPAFEGLNTTIIPNGQIMSFAETF